MKAIFKIEQHLPDTKQIIVKFCKATSHKSIDDYGGMVLSYDSLDLSENEKDMYSNTLAAPP